jgi:DNA (cytosine-5)-methyltransferase 1
VDIVNQKRYPYEFHMEDALDFAAEYGHDFDVIHASPPCQAYSITKHSHKAQHPDLVDATRAVLQAIGKPYVIENVVGAPLNDPLVLCGSMFGIRATDLDGEPLALRRHRLFESNVFLMAPQACDHDPTVMVGGVYGGGPMQRSKTDKRGGYTPKRSVRAELMGMDWASNHGLSQAIPPVYTEFIGGQLIGALAHVS